MDNLNFSDLSFSLDNINEEDLDSYLQSMFTYKSKNKVISFCPICHSTCNMHLVYKNELKFNKKCLNCSYEKEQSYPSLINSNKNQENTCSKIFKNDLKIDDIFTYSQNQEKYNQIYDNNKFKSYIKNKNFPQVMKYLEKIDDNLNKDYTVLKERIVNKLMFIINKINKNYNDYLSDNNELNNQLNNLVDKSDKNNNDSNYSIIDFDEIINNKTKILKNQNSKYKEKLKNDFNFNKYSFEPLKLENYEINNDLLIDEKNENTNENNGLQIISNSDGTKSIKITLSKVTKNKSTSNDKDNNNLIYQKNKSICNTANFELESESKINNTITSTENTNNKSLKNNSSKNNSNDNIIVLESKITKESITQSPQDSIENNTTKIIIEKTYTPTKSLTIKYPQSKPIQFINPKLFSVFYTQSCNSKCLLITVSNNTSIDIHDLSTLQINAINNLLFSISNVHKYYIWSIRHYVDKYYQYNRDLLISSGADRLLKIFEISSFNYTLVIAIETNHLNICIFTCNILFDYECSELENKNDFDINEYKNNIYFISAEFDDYIKIYDYDCNHIKDIGELNYKINYSEVYYNKYILYTCCNGIFLYEFSTGEMVKQYQNESEQDKTAYHALIFNSKNSKTIISSHFCNIKIWDYEKCSIIKCINIKDCECNLIGISLWNQQYAYIGGQDGLIRMFDIKNGLIKCKYCVPKGKEAIWVEKINHPIIGDSIYFCDCFGDVMCLESD